MPFRGRPLIEYSIAAAARWKPIVVCGNELARCLAGHDIALVRNDEPERGMSHSLALANRAIDDDVAIGVLLADKPLVSEQLIETILRASLGADVTYPQRDDDQPGHPVVLSPRARRLIGRLPSGDTLRSLRAQPDLVARAIETADEGAFFDIDTLDAFER